MATLVTRGGTSYSPAGNDGQPTRTEIVDLIGEDGLTVIASFQNTSGGGSILFGIGSSELTETQISNLVTFGNISGIKTYRALLSQSSTNAPVAEVLENTLGVVPTFTYNDVGDYLMESGSAFTEGLTFIGTPAAYASGEFAKVYWQDASTIRIFTTTNNLLSSTSIEVLVYSE